MSTEDGDVLLVQKNEQCNKLILELAQIKENVNIKDKELVITNMQEQLVKLFHEELKLRLEQSIKEKEEIIANTQKQLNENKLDRHQIEENYYKLKLELEQQEKNVKWNEACITNLKKELDESKSETYKLRKKKQVIQIALPDLKKVLTVADQIYESELRKREQDFKKNDARIDNLYKGLEECKSESVELRKKIIQFEKCIEPPKNREKVSLDFFGGDIIIVALLTTAAPVVGVVFYSLFH